MTHIEVRFSGITEDISNMLVAILSGALYEGFEEEGTELKAFILQSLFRREELDDLIRPFDLPYTISELPETNWNKVWESNFQPVTVDDFCSIRAEFHTPGAQVAHEILITPKMSFGTGHHATTYMMILQMKTIGFTNNTVLDFGTGTGVLAILAEKLGAASIVAIDNDQWSIANARENFTKNNSQHIHLEEADSVATGQVYDIILANITRNVILDNFSCFMDHLAAKGVLVLSGLLHDDESYILDKANEYGLTLENKLLRENWLSLKFIR